jgi:hypothetical protein
MKKYLYIVIGYLVLLLAIAALIWLYRDARQGMTRYRNNYEALGKQVQYYKDVNGGLVGTIQDIELSKRQLKDETDAIINRMKDEYLDNHKKLKRLEKLLYVQYAITDSLRSIPKDTFIIRIVDGVPVADSFRLIDFNDGFLDASVYVRENNADLLYKYGDSLFISSYWDRHDAKLLGINWNFLGIGRKEYYNDIEFSNPKSTVKYAKSVVIKKRK